MSLKNRAQWLSFITNELPVRIHDNNIIQTLKLSYDLLPSYIKHCFAYCSLFPKGQDISVKSLIQLWIAQGFISSSNSDECLEDAGLGCFEVLLQRSFFNVGEMDDLGNVVSCTMHDFMHDLAAKVAGLESTYVDLEGRNVSKLTRHMSCNLELVLSQQNSNPLPCAEHLRTLMLVGGKWKEGAWKSICQEFRRLRALVLDGLRIKEVSYSIENFKHLRYLDLSMNDMETLPDSITNLVNLEVLKLNGCSELKTLPREINKLVNLKHLDIGCSFDFDLCESLEHMPNGIGQLTSLQTLSCFVVAKRSSESNDIGGLDELIGLNKLRGRLEILVRRYEKISTELLGKKEHLQALTIQWDLSDGASDWSVDLYDEMLQSLQPHSILEELSVEGYGGISFPNWLSNLPSLVGLHLNSFPSCKHIPSLGGIPSLKHLEFQDLHDLEYIDSEGAGEREVSTFFPSLESLEIFDCPSLKGWWKKNDDHNNDEASTSRTPEEVYFPMLSFLSILNCSNLTSMPLFPSLEDALFLSTASSVPLQQTMKMTAWEAPSSVSSSSSIRPLSKLKKLDLEEINDLESLPEDGLQNLSSVQRLAFVTCPRLKCVPLSQEMHTRQRLFISDCPQLRSLSQSQAMPHLPSLQVLYISSCTDELSGRLRSKEAVDWPNIAHIPEITIDRHCIQRDGQYKGSE